MITEQGRAAHCHVMAAAAHMTVWVGSHVIVSEALLKASSGLCRKWFALLVALIYTLVGVMAAIGAIRSIVQNAVTYHIFANL